MSSSNGSRSAPNKPSIPDAPVPSTSTSRSRPRFALPTPGSPEFTPFLATGVLVLLIALQIALPQATDLPPASAVAPRHPRPLRAQPTPPYPGFVDQDVFDPQRKGGAGGALGGGGTAPLQVMGIVSSSRGAAALIRPSSAPSRFVRAGAVVGDWKVISIGRDSVWIAKGETRRRLPVGAAPELGAPPPTPAASPSQEPAE